MGIRHGGMREWGLLPCESLNRMHCGTVGIVKAIVCTLPSLSPQFCGVPAGVPWSGACSLRHPRQLHTPHFVCHSQLFHRLQNHRPLLYRKLPELTAEDFSKIDVSQFGWIHFEASFLQPAKSTITKLLSSHRVEVLKVTAG